MVSISRIHVIKSHIVSNLSFPADNSLSAYRSRGDRFSQDHLHNCYFEIGLPYYSEFLKMFKSCSSFSHSDTPCLSKSEKRAKVLKNLCELREKMDFNRKNHLENSVRGFIFGRVLFAFDMSVCVRLGVNSTLYLDALLSLGSQKHDDLIDKAYLLREIGCFAMTELGHGSNVSKLGTTATYVHETREFVINTPDSMCAKWWIGGARETAVRTIVFAQLYVNNKNRGVHAFVVPLRDPKTFKTVQGVIIGDCGPKIENDGIDNGFIIFRNLKVPYDSLLDSISQVNESGEFVSLIKKKEKRLGRMLSVMIRGRTAVTSCSEANLNNALTIAIRYSAIRKQFGPPESPEVPILDYQLTRTRLMPHLANLFAINAACEITYLNFDVVKGLMNINPECEEAVEFHAILSVFKALTSEWSYQGIHETRKVLGGIGYSSFARIGEILAKHDVNLTWEGDNFVLLQQTAGFVIKNMQKNLQGKNIKAKSLDVLKVTQENYHRKAIGLSTEEIFEVFKVLFNELVKESMIRLQENIGTCANVFDAWNLTQPTMHGLAKVFGHITIIKQLIVKLGTLKQKCEDTHRIVEKITKLFMVDKLIHFSSDLLAAELINKEDLATLRQFFYRLCFDIGENAVKIIDSIAYDDFINGSPLGHSDGQAYKRFAEQIESQEDCYEKKN